MSTIPVTIDEQERDVTIPQLFEHLNYISYRSHRRRLTDWSTERVQAMFVRYGMGNLTEVERWERLYLEEQRNDNR
jgi:hypothetical protein